MIPDLTILIVTFDRLEEIKRTLYAFLKNVDCPREKLHFHLADNNTSERTETKDYINTITSEFKYLNWTYSIEKRCGWGYNVNTALKQIKNNFIFLIEDDYVALRKIRLIDGVELMQSNQKIGIVRYDGTAAHSGLVYHQREHKTDSNRFDYLLIDKQLSKHLNVYSNRPHLRNKKVVLDDYGYYVEGKRLGFTEEDYAHRIKDGMGKSDIVILDDGIQLAFQHIGVSRQRTEFDK